MGPLETPYGCYTLTRVFLGLDLMVSEYCLGRAIEGRGQPADEHELDFVFDEDAQHGPQIKTHAVIHHVVPLPCGPPPRTAPPGSVDRDGRPASVIDCSRTPLSVPRGGPETELQGRPAGLRETLDRLDRRADTTVLEPRNRRLGRANPLGQICLSEASTLASLLYDRGNVHAVI